MLSFCIHATSHALPRSLRHTSRSRMLCNRHMSVKHTLSLCLLRGVFSDTKLPGISIRSSARHLFALPRNGIRPRYALLHLSPHAYWRVCTAQSAPSPLPAVQTQAGRDVSDVGSDGGDAQVYMPPSPCALPTVDEEGSEELLAELPDDIVLQKKAGEVCLQPQPISVRQEGQRLCLPCSAASVCRSDILQRSLPWPRAGDVC